MKKKWMKTLAAVMTAVMLLTAVPVFASAADAEPYALTQEDAPRTEAAPDDALLLPDTDPDAAAAEETVICAEDDEGKSGMLEGLEKLLRLFFVAAAAEGFVEGILKILFLPFTLFG